MLSQIKKRLYFVVAAYFGVWAKLVLRRWKPRVVVLTGSSGKTTLLHLVKAQLGDDAIYTHHANSALGIPFHILGMPTNIASPLGWIGQIIKAPFKVLRSLPDKKLYVVEADCDRPKEGKFLGSLLKPEAVLWVSVFRTHSMNFEKLVGPGQFGSVESAIAYEFGNYIAFAKNLVVVNGDQPEVVEQLERASAGVRAKQVSIKSVSGYGIKPNDTVYKIGGQEIHLPGLHAKEVGLSLQLVNELLEYLDKPLDASYQNLQMPPSRSSVFAGKKDITIVDSSYNTGLGAMTVMLKLFDEYPAEHKWIVIGDILEQGGLEAEEHQKLAEVINSMKPEAVIFLGPRTAKHTYPLVKAKLAGIPVESFDSPKEVLDYLQANLKGGEAVMFKGGRYLEGVIEQLLADPDDASKLARRGEKWTKVRQKWGLPA